MANQNTPSSTSKPDPKILKQALKDGLKPDEASFVATVKGTRVKAGCYDVTDITDATTQFVGPTCPKLTGSVKLSPQILMEMQESGESAPSPNLDMNTFKRGSGRSGKR